jgi:hypothetical protein
MQRSTNATINYFLRLLGKYWQTGIAEVTYARDHIHGGQKVLFSPKGKKAMSRNTTPLTEKVLVSVDTKQDLMAIREPGERYGDVVARVMKDWKRDAFVAHLDRVLKTGEFVPLDSDPEYRAIKEEMLREG